MQFWIQSLFQHFLCHIKADSSPTSAFPGFLSPILHTTAEVQIMRGIQLFSPQFLSYYKSKPYVVHTQKNRLTETILLSTHNIGLDGQKMNSEHEKRPLSRALQEMFYFCL